MGSWFDSDGLYRQFGPQKAVPEIAGEYNIGGDLREVEITLDLTTLTTTDTIISNTFVFPTNMRIEQVEVVVHTAATSGGSATLDVGFYRTDRTTAIAAQGAVAALALASITPAGKKIVLNQGSTSAGTLIGSQLSNVGYITAKANTAVFTAGSVRIRIKYYNQTNITF